MKNCIVILVCFLSTIQITKAGFPIGKGRGLLVPSYTFYTAKGYWDANSAYRSYGNGSFNSHYFSLYGVYGISRSLNLVYNVPFVSQVDNNTSGASKIYTATGLGDASIGLSHFFKEFDNDRHVSLTGSLIVPLYQNQGNPYPNIGFQSLGGEVKLGFAGSATGGFRNPYYDIDFGVRQYFNLEGPTQLFTSITGGVPVSDSWKLSGTLSGVYSTSNTALTNQTTVFYNYNKSFSYVRIAANAGYTVNEDLSIWGGIFSDIAGKSVGRGSGLSVSAVIKL